MDPLDDKCPAGMSSNPNVGYLSQVDFFNNVEANLRVLLGAYVLFSQPRLLHRRDRVPG